MTQRDCVVVEFIKCSKINHKDGLQMKILLVEDDKTIASGLEYSLQQEGYWTVLCHDAASARKVLAEDIDQFTLCLFDLQLPDGTGYELCKMVKERRDIPVIFLTVIDDEVNVVMGLDMGADDYITKPFRVRELLSGSSPSCGGTRSCPMPERSLTLTMCASIRWKAKYIKTVPKFR